jgi:putative photosynthetic complex assembly protein
MSSSIMNPMPAPMSPNSWRRGALAVVGGVVVVALLSLIGHNYVNPAPSHDPSTPVKSMDLRFIDDVDGSVGVINIADGQVVSRIAPGQDNFVRATMRGLARQRARESKGPDVPFRLTAWQDGRLTLVDLATGRAVELESFGATNEADFARMLHLPEATP